MKRFILSISVGAASRQPTTSTSTPFHYHSLHRRAEALKENQELVTSLIISLIKSCVVMAYAE